MPQGQFRQALTADSAERRGGIMEILFGTEPYRQIEAALKDEARSLQDKLEQAKDRRDTLLKQTDAESVDELKAACEEMCEKCAMAKRTEEEMKGKAGKAAGGALEKGGAFVVKDRGGLCCSCGCRRVEEEGSGDRRYAGRT